MSMAWRVNLQTSHKMALLALCDWANDEGGSLHPSVRRVAERISCSERTAQRVMHELMAGGWLEVIGNLNGGAPGQTRKYRINVAKLSFESVTGDKLAGVTRKQTGDIEDSERVTLTTETGDTLVTQSPIDPPIDPPLLLSTSKLPDCPHVEIIDLFGQHLAELPQPKPELWDGQRAKNLAARWKWCLTAKKRNGDRYATDKASALSFLGRYFGYVAKSDFLMGRNGQWGGCDLAWLVKADNFAKVLQGNYENKEAA